MEEIPHGISIGCYADPDRSAWFSLPSALNGSGNIPAWNSGTAKSEFFMPMTAKKDGLWLCGLSFRVKGYVQGRMRFVLRRYGSKDVLAEKMCDLVRGMNDISFDVGNVLLEKGVEYQLYFAAANNFYPPSVEPGWVQENEYLDFARGSEYYGKDTKLLFAGRVSLAKTDFESIHTYRDLYLIPVCRPIVQPPLEKTLTLDVEGHSGETDLSHGLTGYPVFKDREGSWQFWLDTEAYQDDHGFYGPVGDMAYREIQAKLLEKMRDPFQVRVILDDEPLFYYTGRVWLSGKPTYQYDHAKFTLQYRLYPYKYLVKEPDGDWLWDPFCFETDLATVQMRNVPLDAGQEESFTLVDSDKPSAVYVTGSGKATVSMKNQNGVDYTLVKLAFDTYDWSGDLEMRKACDFYFRTKKQRIALRSITTMLSVKAVQTITLSAGLYRKGSDVALASWKWTKKTGRYFWQGEMIELPDEAMLMDVELEPDTTYRLGFVCSQPMSSAMVPDDDSGTAEWFAEQLENDYIEPLPGEETLNVGDYAKGRTWFTGEMSFYAGDGAVLKPGEKTYVGLMGTSVGGEGKEILVKAEKDTNVTIEYRPAFL